MVLKRPDQPRTRTLVQSIPEHEVLLVFNDDTTAERFSDWLDTAGWEAFRAWYGEMEHDIDGTQPG